LERIMKVVNENLSDSDFNVEKMCDEVGVSRTQLHRKLKEMTGVPTSEFLRNIRLNEAARLIREHKINITQVSYMVGFANNSHFSTLSSCFRAPLNLPFRRRTLSMRLSIVR
jgi:AraC-like DNA-binding protein